ncbi:MAG: EamA family transporter [bacterium]|nr:EamA family transporter [bacterium]
MAHMSASHVFMALVVTFIWGVNFVAIRVGLDVMPPFLLLTFRFAFAALPLIFFIPRPKASFKTMLGISIFMWVGQFSFLFLGIYQGMAAGLSSLIMQAQTIFTVLFSALLFGSRPRPLELLGITIAGIGLAAIAFQLGGQITWSGFSCVLIAAACTAASNIVFRKSKSRSKDFFPIIVWSNLLPTIPMFVLSYTLEGWDQICFSCTQITLPALIAFFFTVWFASLLGGTLWGRLMNAHDPASIVPFLLLVPIFGMGSCILMLGETYSQEVLLFSILVILGLAINQVPAYRQRKLKAQKSTGTLPPSKKSASLSLTNTPESPSTEHKRKTAA